MLKKEPLAHGLDKVDYRQLRIQNPPKPVNALPKGVWVPISVAAYLMKYSSQTIRLMHMTKQLRSIKFPVGPILVDINRYMVEEDSK